MQRLEDVNFRSLSTAKFDLVKKSRTDARIPCSRLNPNNTQQRSLSFSLLPTGNSLHLDENYNTLQSEDDVERMFGKLNDAMLVDNMATPFTNAAKFEPIADIGLLQDHPANSELEELLFSEDPFLLTSDMYSASFNDFEAEASLLRKNQSGGVQSISSLNNSLGSRLQVKIVPMKKKLLKAPLDSLLSGEGSLDGKGLPFHGGEYHFRKSTQRRDSEYKRFISQVCADQPVESDPEDEMQLYLPPNEGCPRDTILSDDRCGQESSDLEDDEEGETILSTREVVALYSEFEESPDLTRPLAAAVSSNYRTPRTQNFRRELVELRKRQVEERKVEKESAIMHYYHEPRGFTKEQVLRFTAQLQNNLQQLVQTLALSLEIPNACTITATSVRLLVIVKVMNQLT